MKVLRIVLISVLATVAVVGLAAYFGLRGLENFMCGVSVVRRVASPDGRLEAVLFERNCGATTDFATNLSVVSAGSKIKNDVGNLLTADSDDGHALLDSGHVIHVSIEWIRSDSLVVRYDRRARVFRQTGSAHGVSVSYSTIEDRGA
jgi:hypothetical protein